MAIMISADDVLTIEWLDIRDLAFGEAQVCDLARADTYRAMMAAAPQPDAHIAPPIVSPDPTRPGRYLIRDGRHRWLAQLALGRDRVRCLVVRPAGSSSGDHQPS